MNPNHKIWQLGLLLIVVLLGGQEVYSATALDVAFRFPVDDTIADRNAGAKGMDLDFRRADSLAFAPGELPLNITGATVLLTINGSTLPDCLRGNLNPAPGQCGFDIVDGVAPGVEFSTLRVVFAGLFPSGAGVSIDVTNVRTADLGPLFDQTPSDWNFTTSTTVPRSPVSLEMVFDISGSMGLAAAPPTGCSAVTRMQTLKDASQSIFSILENYSLPGDKLGIVYFSSTASAFGVSGGTNLKNANSAADRLAIQLDLESKSPTAATSVGGGLQLALTSGFFPSGFPADPNPSKRVFLFSDGEQNTLPCAGEPNTAPCSSSTVTTSPPLRVAGADYTSGIAVCPVTVGQFTGMAATLQQNIAQASSCPHPAVHAIINHPTLCDSARANLESFFAQSLTNLLVGDKLELVRDVNGRIPAVTNSSEKFFANANDVSLSILLSWPQRRRFIPFQLKAPDGTIVDPLPLTRIQRGMSFTTIPLPRFFQGATARWKGEWELQFLGTQLTAPVDYHLIVMLDNENIASDFQLNPGDPGTGEPIPLRVRLTEGGAPVTGATAVVQMLGPENGLGNVLSNTRTPQGDPNTGGDVIRSDAQRKLLLLLADPASASLFKDKNLPSLVLLDNGQTANGDVTANDGIYSGLFTGASLEGHYRFVVNVLGPSATNGQFQRTQLLNVHVRPKPVASNTSLNVLSSTRQPDGSVIVSIKAIPRDSLNNFLGPDYTGGGLRFRTTQGTVESLTDNLDGSYVASIRLPSSASNPDITLEVMGTDVVTRPLSDLNASTLKRWAFSLHAGSTFPHGVLGSIFNSGPSFGADLEYRFTPLFSIEAFLGHDRFPSSFFNDTFHLTHLSLQPKFTFGSGTVRPSVHAGLGAYFPEGGGTHFGGNVGASVQFWVTPNFAVEPSYNYRMVNFSGTTVKYSTLQGGVRFRF